MKMTVPIRVSLLLCHPHNWTQHANARDACGQPCASNSPDAVACCLGEALRLVYPPHLEGYLAAVRAVATETRARWMGLDGYGHDPEESIRLWNDSPGRQYHEVLAVVLAAGV